MNDPVALILSSAIAQYVDSIRKKQNDPLIRQKFDLPEDDKLTDLYLNVVHQTFVAHTDLRYKGSAVPVWIMPVTDFVCMRPDNMVIKGVISISDIMETTENIIVKMDCVMLYKSAPEDTLKSITFQQNIIYHDMEGYTITMIQILKRIWEEMTKSEPFVDFTPFNQKVSDAALDLETVIFLAREKE